MCTTLDLCLHLSKLRKPTKPLVSMHEGSEVYKTLTLHLTLTPHNLVFVILLLVPVCYFQHLIDNISVTSLKDSIKAQASSVKSTMVSHQQLIGDVKSMLTTMAKVTLVKLQLYDLLCFSIILFCQ